MPRKGMPIGAFLRTVICTSAITALR